MEASAFLDSEIGKKAQKPRMNSVTKEMIARTMIGTHTTHVVGQELHFKSIRERNEEIKRKQINERKRRGGMLRNQPSCQSTTNSASTTNARYNFGK